MEISMSTEKDKNATPVACTLHCKASASLNEEIREELKAEDQSLQNILDEQDQEQE